MRPIIGNGIVIPYIIKKICIIEAVAVIVDGILKHVLLFAAGTFVENELLIRAGWWYSWKLKRSEALLEISGVSWRKDTCTTSFRRSGSRQPP